MAEASVKAGARRWVLRETIGNLFLIAILFGIVGRWDWWNGWVLSLVYILWSLGSILFILPVNPQMLAERARPQPGADKTDTLLVGLMGGLLMASYVIACLDVRLGWAPPFPLWVQIAGAAACVLGYDVILQWAMVSNAYFTAIVRIQSERGHSVATGGPYRFVRHPGYTGTILCYAATPLLLGSLCALAPALLACAVLVARTAREDRFLHGALPGYTEFAQRTRYRLLPGVW